MDLDNSNIKGYVCYILRSLNPKYKSKSYVGCTNNPIRRLRQHNGIIKGGAKATKGKGPYGVYGMISGFPNKISALQCEWALKHPDGKRRSNGKYYRLNGRVLGIDCLIQTDKWKNKFDSLTLTLWICVDFMHLINFDHLTNNLTLIPV